MVLRWQRPVPSQKSHPTPASVLATPPSLATPGCEPAGRGVQVPRIARSHASHTPSHARSQHTPWAQKPEAQSLPLAQPAPRASGAAQRPIAQWFPAAQSWSVVQSIRQRSIAHPKGAQRLVTSAGHPPRPSQPAGSVAIPSRHAPGRQLVALPG